MPREPIPSWYFALVVVRHRDGRFLLVQERKHGQLWYVPAGRVEPGETLEAAALRETMEEAGIPVRLTGVLRFEHTPVAAGTRVRVIFTAEPEDDRPIKTEPDAESLGAAWVTIDDLPAHPLRGQEVEAMFRYLAIGGPVAPMTILAREGTAYGP